MSKENTAAKAKRVSNMAKARKLFSAQLTKWNAGEFKNEKRPYGEFRKLLMTEFKKKLGVSNASAATMFNNLKKEALEKDSDLVLQRDPKVARVKSNRGPGRPRKTSTKDESKSESTAS